MQFEVEVHRNELGDWVAVAVEYGVQATGRTESEALARIMDGHPPGEVRESMYRGLDALHEIARRAVDNAIASYETGAGDDVDQVVAEFVERYPPREA